MAQIEFKCPQCGQLVTADDSLRGQVVECPSCEKGIVVPRIQLNVGRPKSVVKLHPAVQNDTNDSSPRDPNVTRRISEFERMAEKESRQKMRQRIHEVLMLVLKTVAVVLVITVGFAKWKEFKSISNSSRFEEAEKQLGVVKEKIRQIDEAAKQKVAESERKVKDAEKKVQMMEASVHEYEQKLADAEKALKEMNSRMDTVSAEHERKMAELNIDHQKELERIKRMTAVCQMPPTATAQNNTSAGSSTESQRRLVRCGRCMGRGEIKRKVTCKYCGGNGKERITTTRWVGGDSFRNGREKLVTTNMDCSHCLPGDFRGRGSKGYTLETLTCPLCEGKGRIPQN